MVAPTSCKLCPVWKKSLFSGLSPESLSLLAEQKKELSVDKKQALFLNTQPTEGVFCLKKGHFKIVQSISPERTAVVRLARAGDIVGHRSVFSSQKYKASAISLCPSQACFIDKKTFFKLIQAEPKLALFLLEKVSKDMDLTEKRILHFHLYNLKQRFVALLLMLKEYYGVSCNSEIKIDLELSRSDLASMISAATENTVRIISQLKKEGLVREEKKKFFLNNINKLIQILEHKPH